MELIIQIAILLFLLFGSAYCAASETALFSLSESRVKAYADDPNWKRRIITQLLRQPKDLLVTVFMLNTFVNILLQNVASTMFGQFAGWSLKVGFPLIITLLFGEIFPKYFGMVYNISVSDYVAPTLSKLQSLLGPIRRFIISITTPISKIMFFYLQKEDNISREELLHVLKTSEEMEVLSKEEAELVCGYIDLQEIIVKELMRPRQDVLFYDIQEEPLSKLTFLFVDQQCSRIPVCNGSLENVLGIITAKDFFLYRKELTSKEKLIEKLNKIFFVPENMLARVLLRRFDEKKLVIAMVVDEYGSIAGLITREDVLEVIIGQIKDYRDDRGLYSKQSETEIIASGKLEIDEFNFLFNSDLQSENNMVTIGGWLTEQLGEIPKSGTKYESEGFLFHVLSATPNRIRRLYVRKLDKPITS